MIIKSGSGDNNFYIGNLGTREKEREREKSAKIHFITCTRV